ncbi:MAG: hypothetical protein K2X32_10250, partial [Phycisphaerales bacterium]|nr:hypothetical protein [Phycisphaerales bacterium]
SIARYSPARGGWSALRGRIRSPVEALALLPGGDVVAGGFSSSDASCVLASAIVRYNVSSGAWSEMGGGLAQGAIVRALAVVPAGDVIVGGQFVSAGGVSASNIARFTPNTGRWSTLGNGIEKSGIVSTLAVLPGGDVIVGGRFSTAAGVAANNIARVNPNTSVWSALGNGIIGIREFQAAVKVVVVMPGGSVSVGGRFVRAGEERSVSFARYNFGDPKTASGK